MKSYWIVTKGHEATLERREVPAPDAKAGQVVIAVRASALNRGELFVGGVVHGGPEKLGGNEASGVVHAVGADVSGIKPGDEVFGRARGAFADYAVMEAHQVLKKPSRLSWEEAAATPLSFITAYEAVIQFGKMKAAEWMLVTGASAGAGVAAIQIAQVVGARSIGTSGSREKLKKLEAIGLDVGLHTRAPEFAQAVRDATGGAGADVAVNLVGGSMFPELLRSLARKGRLAVVGYVDNQHHADIDLSAVHANRFEIFGVSNAKVTAEERALAARGFARDILPAIEAGKVKPVVDSVFPFDELPAAKARMESNAMVGKIVVRIA
jgi:NADPH:quinone reductase-like Zn-dependent oxidoreductase